MLNTLSAILFSTLTFTVAILLHQVTSLNLYDACG